MSKKQQVQDPGIGTKYTINSKRIINKDGSFNVIKIGIESSIRDAYQWMIGMTWSRFFVIIFTFLLGINACFALMYALLSEGQLGGIEHTAFFERFLISYYFSFQTFTTVGYGVIHPVGHLASVIASFEAVIGWMCFAIITGILYGRFSKPSARLMYSKEALITPYDDHYNSLQFRIGNMRNSNLMELEATVLLMKVERKEDGKGILSRNFLSLTLERNTIIFFPLNWTLVHVINENSPLYGKSKEDFEQMDAEILIMIKGFDDTFSQTVHSRFSYKWDEIVWGAKFNSVYETQPSGDIVMDYEKMNDYSELDLN